MKNVSFIPILLISLMVQSCATIITGSRTNLQFDSNPSNARVQIDGIDVGQTPTNIRVKRKLRPEIVTVTKDGYETKIFALPKSFNGWVVGNIIFGGVLGIIIDCLDGSAAIFDSKAYIVQLHSKQDNLPNK